VLRSYSPVRTIGGGRILNALPRKKKRFSEAVISEMKLFHEGALNKIIELFVSSGRFRGVEQKNLSFLTNTGKNKLEEAIKVLKAQQRVILYDRERSVLIHADFLKKARDEILDILTQYHIKFPLKAGLVKEELRSRTSGANNAKLFNYLVHQLAGEGVIVQEKEAVRLKDHKVTLAQDQQKTRRKLEETYTKSGLQPPYFQDIKKEFPGNSSTEVLEVMVKEGVVFKIKEDLYFHHKAINKLKSDLINFLKNQGEITTPQFKEMTGVSRKYTIPLIEYFDRTQVTVRVGDTRVLRKK
jgi:selenocysteine-specific elongation factor